MKTQIIGLAMVLPLLWLLVLQGYLAHKDLPSAEWRKISRKCVQQLIEHRF